MFSTLESNWDQSTRRGRATFVSFTIQARNLDALGSAATPSALAADLGARGIHTTCGNRACTPKS
jgi:hypothetical protein